MKRKKKRKPGKLFRETGLRAKQWKMLRAKVIKKQGYYCAICSAPGRDGASKKVKAGYKFKDGSVAESDMTIRRLYLDHDHKTGRVRGALCFRCNHRLLGRGLEVASIHRVAAVYLESKFDWRKVA